MNDVKKFACKLVYGRDYVPGECPCCQKKIGSFKDLQSEREYTISGLCQDCQDKNFEEDCEDNEDCNLEDEWTR